MELLLSVEVLGCAHKSLESQPAFRVDVVARVEAAHTVADLAAALARHVGLDRGRGSRSVVGPPAGLDVEVPTPLRLLRRGSGPDHTFDHELDPGLPLSRVGLLSGDRIGLAGAMVSGIDRFPVEDRPRAKAVAPALVVASGPDVGGSVGLASAPFEIGRDRSCRLPLSDPTLSRLHLVVEPANGTGSGPEGWVARIAPSPEARGPVAVNGREIDGPAFVAEGDIIRIGATTLTVNSCPSVGHGVAWSEPESEAEELFGDVPFHRTPYYSSPIQERLFEPMGVIPERPEPPRFAYLAALAPLMFGVAMAFLYSPRMLMFAVFSPIVAVAAFIESRRRTSFRFGEGLERYHRKLEQRRAEIVDAFEDERVRRYRCSPDLATLARRALVRSADLWIRDRHAPDYLQLRLGLGNLAPSITIRPETRGDERLRDELEQELSTFASIDDVPITVDLVENSVIALVGTVADTTDLASSLLTQAACLHSPEDLVIVGALAVERRMDSWMKWLPHVRSASSPLAGCHLATSTDHADGLLKEVLAVAEERSGERDRGVDQRWPRLVVVVDRHLEPDAKLVSRLLDCGPKAGLSVIWLTGGTDRVPRQATAVVGCRSLLGPVASTLSHTEPTIDEVAVEIDRTTHEFADDVARSLAAIVDASSATGSSVLPRLVTMQSALATEVLDADWVARQWSRDRGYSVPTPLGLSDDGPFVVDLVAHGPHALVGGTSGSGKSELLMAMVAGLIALNPPSKVNVLFVDYKGGASSDVFRSAPHTVGYVTNLDGLMARRALTSLRAELNRRMNLLQGRAKDLAEMIERFPDEAPPSLVIVVDEFATLIKEVPDFVAGIVDIAQRGRSLGIHLVLSTQRPSGAVNDNILANTNLRISLRMLDAIESTSVIGTNDAAMIPVPLKGRAFARVGPGEIVAFQSAWSGAPLLDVQGLRPIEIDRFRSTEVVASINPSEIDESAPALEAAGSQLDELLAAVAQTATTLQLGPVRSPWHDELPPCVELETVLDQATEADRRLHGWPVVVGLVDDPERQCQYPAVVDLERGGGLVVFGTGGSGKTTALQTIAVSAAVDDAGRGGDDLTIFGLDFASRELASIAALPQCVEVASGQDLEAVTRIITVLDELLDHRRSVIGETTGNIAKPAARSEPFAPTLLLIDDYGNLAQCFEGAGAPSGGHGWLERLNRIVVDGRQVGMYTALTATRRASVKASLLSAISNRIVLRQAEAGGYPELGVPSSVSSDIELGPGRGFWGHDKLMQLAMAGDVARVAESLSGHVAAAVVTSCLPRDVRLDGPRFEVSKAAPLSIPVGLADMAPDPVTLDLSANNLAVLGDPRSGRSTTLATIAHQLQVAEQSVWAAGPLNSPLADQPGLTASAFGPADDLVSLLEELVADLETQRRPSAPFLLIDDVDLIQDSRVDALIAQVGALGCRWVAATVSLRGYSADYLALEMKKARSFLYLRPPGAREVQEVTGCLPPLRPGLAMPPGRGVLVENRRSTVVQIARQ